MILNDDPEVILTFSGFVQGCQTKIKDLGIQDDFFLALEIRLNEFYPRFLDHAEVKFNERL